jgi:hypothetical protein
MEFTSFKKALRSMPDDIANTVELVSFHSTSKVARDHACIFG